MHVEWAFSGGKSTWIIQQSVLKGVQSSHNLTHNIQLQVKDPHKHLAVTPIKEVVHILYPITFPSNYE